MKYIKLLKFDLKEGIIRNKLFWICSLLIGSSLFLNFWLKINYYEKLDMIEGGTTSFADYFLYIYGGMKKYSVLSGERFIVPIIWLMVFVTIPFILVNYPLKDMYGVGQQMLVRANGRRSWWMSKCCWNIFATLLYHGIIILIGFIMCNIIGLSNTVDVNWNLQNILYSIVSEDGYVQCVKVPLKLCLIPILISVALNLFQMTISLFIKPMFSFLATVLIMCFSAYYCTTYMVGNYGMMFRFEPVLPNGMEIKPGYIVSSAIIVIAIIAGMVRFCRYDILNQD